MLFGRFHNHLVNYGLSDEDYQKIRPSMIESTARTLKIASIIGCIYLFLVGVFYTLKSSFTWMSTAYFMSSGFMFVIYVCNELFSIKYTKTLKYFVYAYSLILFAVGILIGTIANPDQTAVSFIVFILILPIVFTDRPYRVITVTILVIACFVFCDVIYKEDKDIVFTDMVNVIAFGTLSLVLSTYLGNNKVMRYFSELNAIHLANYDLLTELKNRNCYENSVDGYADEAKENVTCIYVDVNGLHQLNNMTGHDAGDKMLKCVADIVKKYAGEENAYRIGGDEFVSFVLDKDAEEIQEIINGIKREVKENNYSISFGAMTMDKKDIDMYKLIKTSEALMFLNKEKFYKESGMEHR